MSLYTENQTLIGWSVDNEETSITTEERFPLTFLLQIQNEMSGEFSLAAGEIQHVDTALTLLRNN